MCALGYGAMDVEDAVRTCASVLEDSGGVSPQAVKMWVGDSSTKYRKLIVHGSNGVLSKEESLQMLAILRVTVAALGALLLSCATAMKRLLSQVRENEDSNTQLMKETTKLQQELAQLQNDSKKVHEELKSAEERARVLEELEQELKDELQKKNVAVDKIRVELAAVEIQSADLKELVEQKGVELRDVKQELETLRKTFEGKVHVLEQSLQRSEKFSAKNVRAAQVLTEREEMVRHQLLETRRTMFKYQEAKESAELEATDLRDQLKQAERAKGSVSRSVSYSSQQTQTSEASKEDSLALTKVLFGIESMAAGLSDSATKLRSANAVLRGRVNMPASSVPDNKKLTVKDGEEVRTKPERVQESRLRHRRALNSRTMEGNSLTSRVNRMERVSLAAASERYSSVDSGVEPGDCEADPTATVQAAFAASPREQVLKRIESALYQDSVSADSDIVAAHDSHARYLPQQRWYAPKRYSQAGAVKQSHGIPLERDKSP